MRAVLLPAMACLALASCGSGDQPANRAQGGPAMDNATLTKFSLTSDDFQDGQPIPTQFTCDGAD